MWSHVVLTRIDIKALTLKKYHSCRSLELPFSAQDFDSDYKSWEEEVKNRQFSIFPES